MRFILLMLLFAVVSGNAEPSKSEGCKQYHQYIETCHQAFLSSFGLLAYVRNFCKNMCDTRAENQALNAVDLSESHLRDECSPTERPCAIERIRQVDACGGGLARFRELLKEIAQEREKSKACALTS